MQCTAASCPLAVHNVQLCSMQCGAALFHAVWCSAVPCSVVQHCSMQCGAALFHAVQCSTVSCSAVQQFHAVQCSTVSYNAVQHCAIMCSMFHTVQCNTVLYSAALFHTMLCRTVPYSALQHIPCSVVQLCSIQSSATKIQCNISIQFSATLFYTMQHCSIQCNVTQFHTVQCNTVLCSAVPNNAVQQCSIQRNATLLHTAQSLLSGDTYTIPLHLWKNVCQVWFRWCGTG